LFKVKKLTKSKVLLALNLSDPCEVASGLDSRPHILLDLGVQKNFLKAHQNESSI